MKLGVLIKTCWLSALTLLFTCTTLETNVIHLWSYDSYSTKKSATFSLKNNSLKLLLQSLTIYGHNIGDVFWQTPFKTQLIVGQTEKSNLCIPLLAQLSSYNERITFDVSLSKHCICIKKGSLHLARTGSSSANLTCSRKEADRHFTFTKLV